MNHRVSLRRLVPWLMVLGLVVLWQTMPAAAEQKANGTVRASEKAGMSHYLVISPHTPEQCLATLDAVEAMPNGKMELAKWDWGCMSGDHTGYLIVSASSADDALKHVPDAERATAKAIKLNKFTEDQIKSFHEKK